jgi:hypothetical protein
MLAIYLDIKGAFNSITFKAAIGAMQGRGFPKNITAWYNHFLHNQVSTLELDNCRFTKNLETGTPQGGVVSPIVWNVCIDPILKKLNTNKPVKVIGFADDVVIMVTGCDPTIMVKRAQPSINAMVDWGKESGLEFNTEKTVVVMYTQKKTTIKDYHEKVKVNGQIIEFSSEAKYLGITLDSRLNWNSHLKDKVSKARKLLFAVKNSIAKTIGPKPSITRRAYKTLIVPMISYGCHLFADKLTTTTLQNKLSRLNRLACLSLGSVPPGDAHHGNGNLA